MRVQSKVGTWGRLDWFSVVIAEFSLSNLGNYAVLAILSLYFVHTLNLPAAQAGGLMLFTSSFRLSRVFVAPLVDRFSARRAAFVSLSMSSLGTLGMAVVRAPLLLVLMLLIAGAGYIPMRCL
jgi:Na+/melibiose symporter-like transporter